MTMAMAIAMAMAWRGRGVGWQGRILEGKILGDFEHGKGKGRVFNPGASATHGDGIHVEVLRTLRTVEEVLEM